MSVFANLFNYLYLSFCSYAIALKNICVARAFTVNVSFPVHGKKFIIYSASSKVARIESAAIIK